MKNWNGFFTLVYRECYRFARLSGQTIAPPILTTLLFILIFGYSLGARIREIHGVAYILYILPGLAVMGVVNNAYANTSTSLFMARMDRSLENMLVCPLSPLQLVTSFILGGLIRGLVIGFITLAVSIPAVHLQVHHWGLTFLVFALTSILFASLGIISALVSEGWDQIASFTTFVITPFIYLGGVFFSIHMLPPFWQKVSLANPIFYLVDSTRYAVLERSDLPWQLSLTVLSVCALFSFALCIYLFKRGYKLVR
jgi:ABC-2 type transport system permease protein